VAKASVIDGRVLAETAIVALVVEASSDVYEHVPRPTWFRIAEEEEKCMYTYLPILHTRPPGSDFASSHPPRPFGSLAAPVPSFGANAQVLFVRIVTMRWVIPHVVVTQWNRRQVIHSVFRSV
jgi:hypothetical protein